MTFLELLKDETLSEELLESIDNADLENDEECVEFIANEVKKHGVEVTKEEIQAFLEKQPLSDDELDQVSGGVVIKATVDGGENTILLMKLKSVVKARKARARGRARLA